MSMSITIFEQQKVQYHAPSTAIVCVHVCILMAEFDHFIAYICLKKNIIVALLLTIAARGKIEFFFTGRYDLQK